VQRGFYRQIRVCAPIPEATRAQAFVPSAARAQMCACGAVVRAVCVVGVRQITQVSPETSAPPAAALRFVAYVDGPADATPLGEVAR